MPKRSDRKVFSGAFTGNPFEGLSPEEIYTEIQWGNTPKEIIDIDAPEALISLGQLAKLITSKRSISIDKGNYNLAIGSDSNFLYIFPIGTDYIPEIDDSWTKGPSIKETHYYSDKGGEDCYYYHKHEKPFPVLFAHDNEVHVIIPKRFNSQRSYAVIKEGIVG